MADSSITKKALAAALKELMAQSPLRKISIGDICEKCSMNRKSFYYHFRDKYDLMNWIFYTEFVERLLEDNLREPAEFLLNICRYFHANRAFYLNALEHTGQNSFSEYFSDVMRPLLELHIRDLIGDDDALEFYLVFYTDAFLAAIRRWLADDSLSPERFAELLTRATKPSRI